MSDNLIVSSTENHVRTLRMNNPKKLNGWTLSMMEALFEAMEDAGTDDDVEVLILTGTDPYYSAGVNLSSTIQLDHPARLHEMIVEHNQELFEYFLDFDKPILAAVNGPAIGATVTSATLCDAIIASEEATFSTPFARLGITPEGCSSVHLPRLIGEEAAQRMLGEEGWEPDAEEALEVGLVDEVVEHDDLLDRAQDIAEEWVEEGKERSFGGGSTREELKEVNARESRELADAFLDVPFLMAQYEFLWGREKYGPALMFLALRLTRPVWSQFLPEKA
jgi:enoyl-CoA hydratase/carnithine racemase